MSILAKLNTWQKGAFFGCLFTVIIALIQSLSIGSAYILNRTQFCFTITQEFECSANTAATVILNLFFRTILIFGPIMVIAASLIGLFIMKMTLRDR